MKKIFSVAMGVVLVMGCQKQMETTILEPLPSDQQILSMVPIATPPGAKVFQIPKELTPELREEAIARVQEFKSLSDIFRKYEKESNWKPVDQEIREFLLKKITSELLYHFEQSSANRILRKYLLNGSAITDEKREAISFYTELLIKNHHQDASVMLPALRSLQGYWPEGKISSSAKKSVLYAEELLSKANPCADCPNAPSLNKEERKTAEAVSAGQNMILSYIGKSIQPLKELAQE